MNNIFKTVHNFDNLSQTYSLNDINTKSHKIRKNLCQLYIKQVTNNQNIQGAQKTKLPKKSMTSEKIGK
jgi:hypothetical protein